MRPEEANVLKKLGKRAFLSFESLFITMPKDALVAEIDGRIVSGVIVKIVKGTGSSKVGYIDFAFVDRAFQNQGIGNKIYKATIDYLWSEGCDFITALVKDDNVGSFALLEKNGLSRVTIYEARRVIGTKGFLNQLVHTALSFGYGMDFYLGSSEKQKMVEPKQNHNIEQISAYLGVNIGFLLLATFFTGNFTIELLGAYLTLLGSTILSGFIMTFFSKREWNYRLLNGGIIFPVISTLLGGVFPMGGNWYPKKYENTRAFHKAMGLNASISWIALLLITYCTFFFDKNNLFYFYINQIGVMFLLYRVVAFYPLSSFGGRRVFIWNKAMYLILSILSILLIWLK
jgi:GNAT superfamily N-acetyltransferase